MAYLHNCHCSNCIIQQDSVHEIYLIWPRTGLASEKIMQALNALPNSSPKQKTFPFISLPMPVLTEAFWVCPLKTYHLFKMAWQRGKVPLPTYLPFQLNYNEVVHWPVQNMAL